MKQIYFFAEVHEETRCIDIESRHMKVDIER